MVSKVFTFTFSGVEVNDVEVQVHFSPGIPNFTIVGLADKTIAESKERVRAALSSIGLALPAKKIIVNLAPADLIKEGSHFDLAIAIGLLAAMNVVPSNEVEEYIVLGELGLDASILPVSGILPAAMGAVARGKSLICPEANGKEAAWSGNQNILAPGNLINLINHFKGTQVLTLPIAEPEKEQSIYPDFSDIIGQEFAKRAIEIAAAGGHNILMSGPPGVGKSMIAQRLPGILPSMSSNEILECSMIASVSGLISEGKLAVNRPFRAPHHSCSVAAMVGGGMGRRVKPGEISLAHNGVLFLDELPEFPGAVLDALRQPLETREILIARANSHIKFPANFQLVAAMNPCKCGYLADTERNCHKAPRCGSEYQNKISGPIIDRFDIVIELLNLHPGNLNYESKKPESSKDIALRVRNAREIQLKRYDGMGIRVNAELSGQALTDYTNFSDNSIELLNEAAVKFKLSMRGYNKILKVARTIADLNNDTNINKSHISESLSYREVNYNLKKSLSQSTI